MNTSLDSFPIYGSTVCSLLGAQFSPEQLWVIMDIETLSDTKALILGELWRRVQTGPVKLTTRELCRALALASQIISLDIYLEDNPLIEVLIDDGITVKCQLSKEDEG